MNLKENSLEKSKMIANEIKNSLEEKNIFHLRDIIYDTNEVTLEKIFLNNILILKKFYLCSKL